MFRGTPIRHKPGDLIEPAWLGRVYAATTEDIALDVLTLNHDDGWVYEVEPTGACQPDDEYPAGVSWWSTEPMVVVREVCRHPSHHPATQGGTEDLRMMECHDHFPRA